MGVVGAVVAGRQIDGTPRFLLPATALVVVFGQRRDAVGRSRH